MSARDASVGVGEQQQEQQAYLAKGAVSLLVESTEANSTNVARPVLAGSNRVELDWLGTDEAQFNLRRQLVVVV